MIVGDYMMNSVIKSPFDASIGSHDFSTLSRAEYHLENDACYREKLEVSVGKDLATKDLDEVYPVQ